MDRLPTNIRFFLESLMGKTDPITEKDFSQEELKRLSSLGKSHYETVPGNIRKLAQAQLAQEKDNLLPSTLLREYDKTFKQSAPTSKQIGYPNYYFAPDRANWGTALKRSFTDPNFTLATSLGNFGMEDMGDSYRVFDTYSWNGDFGRPIKNLSDVFNQASLSKPTLILNALAELYAPKVERPIDFRVPK